MQLHMAVQMGMCVCMGMRAHLRVLMHAPAHLLIHWVVLTCACCEDGAEEQDGKRKHTNELQAELAQVREKLQEAEKASQAHSGKDASSADAKQALSAINTLRDKRTRLSAQLNKSRDEVMSIHCVRHMMRSLQLSIPPMPAPASHHSGMETSSNGWLIELSASMQRWRHLCRCSLHICGPANH